MKEVSTFQFTGSIPLLTAMESELIKMGYELGTRNSGNNIKNNDTSHHMGTNLCDGVQKNSKKLKNFKGLYFGSIDLGKRCIIFNLPQDWETGMKYAEEAIKSEFWDENKPKSPIFEAGKFYKAYWNWDKGYDLVFKVKSIDEEHIITQWDKNLSQNRFENGGAFYIPELINIEEITPKEADEFVPDNSEHKLFPKPSYTVGTYMVSEEDTMWHGVKKGDICEIEENQGTILILKYYNSYSIPNPENLFKWFATYEEAKEYSNSLVTEELCKVGNIVVMTESTEETYHTKFKDFICEIINPTSDCPDSCITTNLPYSLNIGGNWFNVNKSEIRQATEEEIRRYKKKGKPCHITNNEKWDVGTYVVVRKPSKDTTVLVKEGVYEIKRQTKHCIHIDGDVLDKRRNESELKWFNTINEAEKFFQEYLNSKTPEFTKDTWMYCESIVYKWIFRYKGKNYNDTYPSDEFYIVTKPNTFQSEGKSEGLYCHNTGYPGPAKATNEQILDILKVVAIHKGLVKGAEIVPPNIEEMIGNPKFVTIKQDNHHLGFDVSLWVDSGRWNSRIYDDSTRTWAKVVTSEPVVSTPAPVVESKPAVKVPKFVKIFSAEKYDWGKSLGDEKAVVGDVYKVKSFSRERLSVDGKTEGYITILNPKKGIDYGVVEEETLCYLKFGNLDFTINKGSKTATCKHGRVTLKEIKELLDYFDKPVSILGYNMEIKNTGDWFIKFGCCEGTIKELRAIHKALTE